MAKVVVFIGPSLEAEEADRLLGGQAVVRPPIRRGDLPRLEPGTGVIAIVDGVFLGDSAVGHREIVEKLKQGTEVVGGGSMGALRAFELRTFGMKGIGKVHKMYAEGRIEGDDEVALIFDPDTLLPLSEPLVNMRWNLWEAAAQGIIGEDEAEQIILRLKGLFYPRRSKEAMLDIAKEVLPSRSLSNFAAFVDDKYIDVKRSDAIDVIKYAKAKAEGTMFEGF